MPARGLEHCWTIMLVLASLGSVSSYAGCVSLSDTSMASEDSSGEGGRGGELGQGGDGGVGGALNPDPVTGDVDIVCWIDIIGAPDDLRSTLAWQLTADPTPVKTNGQFTTRFDVVAVFPESFLDTAQGFFPGSGVREVNLVAWNATVLAYSGATGPPAVLTAPDVPYQCAREDPPGTRPMCDPANDLPGEPGVVVGNTDCAGNTAVNPCGRFIPFPISEDCSVGGTCWNVGRTEGSLCSQDDFCKDAARTQCDNNGFCVTGDLRLELTPAVQIYTAMTGEEATFGWHEPDRGNGWPRLFPVFEEPAGPNGLRLYAEGVPVAFECILGTDTGDNTVGPLPDEELLFVPISEARCPDGTSLCPEGFRITSDGRCRFSAESEPVTLEDIEASPEACTNQLPFATYEADFPIDDRSVLDSPSLAVRAALQVTNVDDSACASSGAAFANIDFLDEDRVKLANTLLLFTDPTKISVSDENPALRTTVFFLFEGVPWGSSPDVCCRRTFQTFWEASVAQCEGW